MAGKTINDLSVLTTPTANDLLAIWDAEAGSGVEPTKKMSIGDFVVNNLASTSTTQPLSAAQGNALNDLINRFTNIYLGNDLFVRYRNGVIYVRTGDNCDNTELEAVTIPLEYRAAFNFGVPCMYYKDSSYLNGFINVGPNGKFSLKDTNYSDVTSSNIRACFSYVP